MRLKPSLVLLFVALAVTGCASRGPSFDPAAGENAGRGGELGEGRPRSEVALFALGLLGRPYALGGGSPETGFDCSGLVAYVYRETLRRSLPRTADEQSRIGMAVPTHALAPGDLVFFNTLRREFSHVGIYLGEARFIHAPSAGGVVRVDDMRMPYWTSRYNGARRVY
jgi:cell wall-associated NlpC family hydrolase